MSDSATEAPFTKAPERGIEMPATTDTSAGMGLLSGSPSENLSILKDVDSKKEATVLSLPSLEIQAEGALTTPIPSETARATTTDIATAYGGGYERMDLSQEETEAVEAALAAGQEPSDILAQIGQDEEVRVVGFGETHFDPPMQDFTVDAIKQLAEQGFTHLALEMDEGFQPAIDRFMEDGDEAALRGSLGSRQKADYWAPRIAAAREAGLDVVAMDENPVFTRKPREPGETGPRQESPEETAFKQNRNQAMFENVDEILSSDPDARVIVINGSAHLGSRNLDPERPTLGQLIENKYGDEALATIISQTDTAQVDTLHPFLAGLGETTILPTHNADGSANALGDLRRNQRKLDENGSGWYRDWDYVAMFPGK